MKKILFLALVLIARSVFTENTIIAVVNNSPISLNSVQYEFIVAKSKEDKIEILKDQIDFILQLQKANILNIQPTLEDINLALLEIAQSNKLSIDELLNYDEIKNIKQETSERLSILNLQRYIRENSIDEGIVNLRISFSLAVCVSKFYICLSFIYR